MDSDEVGEKLAKRYFVVAENIPAHDNFYFSLFNRGMKGYDPANKPNFAAPYLAKDNYEELKVSRKIRASIDDSLFIGIDR